MRRSPIVLVALTSLAALPAAAQSNTLGCDLSGYRAQAGLTAAVSGDALTLAWDGTERSQTRVSFGIAAGVPTVRELAVRRNGGAWSVLGQNLRPEYRVVSGIRRFSEQQAEPLR